MIQKLLEIPDLTPEQFRMFADLIHKEASITMKEAKITLLSNRLRRRMRHLGLSTFDDYYKLISSQTREGVNEIVHFLEAVTTNESYFWRTINNFELLKDELLPQMLKQFPGRKLRFWSAGCSTGEEPYNLAIELTEAMKAVGPFDFEIIASDISQQVIDYAQKGRYSGRKIEKIPQTILQRYFRPIPDSDGIYEIREDIKKRITFKVENLFRSTNPAFHMIFCRNVMIYFSRADQETLANCFYNQLVENGYLIIGHSESLHMMQTSFKHLHFQSGVVYARINEKDGLNA